MDVLDFLQALELLAFWRFLICVTVAAGIAVLLWQDAPAQFGWGTALLVFAPAVVTGVAWEMKARRRPSVWR